MEATEMRRSTLQRKDRDELTQIAQALGRRPPTRARKGEIIDLIIELATGGDDPPAVSDAGGDTPAAGDAEGEPVPSNGSAAVEPTGASSSGDETAGAGRATGPTADGDGDESSSAPVETATPNGTRRNRSDNRSDNRAENRSDNRSENRSDNRAENRSDNRSENRSDNRAEKKGEKKGADRNGGRDEQPPTDSGNRRRRRRGRDRDRDRDRDDGWDGEPIAVAGHLDLRDEGYGFLRVNGALPSKLDAYVPVKMIRQFGLRKGDHLTGTSRPANRNEKNPALLTIDSVNGSSPEEAAQRPRFSSLVPVFATDVLALEQPDDPDNVAARIIDLVAPIGKGQRVLLLAPPRSGATTVLKQIAQSVEVNDPDVHVVALLIDERPEEVTEMRRWLQRGEVVATTFDQPAEEHTQVAEMTIERATRMVELGRHVVMVFDGLSRLARAYNHALSNAGRAYSGHVESGAVHLPKRFFGAGRAIEGGGSLTIVATVRTDTGHITDGVILEELAGCANTEIRLDRWAAARGIHPAIDVLGSVSRHEERMLDDEELVAVDKLRAELRSAGGEGPGAAVAALESLLARFADAPTNAELVAG